MYKSYKNGTYKKYVLKICKNKIKIHPANVGKYSKLTIHKKI